MYKILARMIERKNYNSIEDMENKLSILMLNEQITKEEYQNLIDLLNKQ